jgi:hypothetical protein
MMLMKPFSLLRKLEDRSRPPLLFLEDGYVLDKDTAVEVETFKV